MPLNHCRTISHLFCERMLIRFVFYKFLGFPRCSRQLGPMIGLSAAGSVCHAAMVVENAAPLVMVGKRTSWSVGRPSRHSAFYACTVLIAGTWGRHWRVTPMWRNGCLGVCNGKVKEYGFAVLVAADSAG